MTSDRQDRAWPVAILLLLLLFACFGRLVAQPSALIVDPDRPSLDHARRADDPPTIGNDATRLFIPHHAAIAGHLARIGRVPTWDDRGFGGRPLVGNPQAGLFYPPIWLAWRIWSPGILGWLTLLHLLWAGCGTYFLARAIDLDRWGSAIAAGCFQASPYVLAQTFEGHYPHVWSASWMPWAFLAALGLRRGDLRSGLMLVPILSCASLAGHLQETYLLAVALLAWGLYDLFAKIRAQATMGQVGRPALIAVSLVVMILGVTAVEWIPDLLASRWAVRDAALPIDQAGRYHLFPINALQLLSPFALGRPWDYLGHDNYWESLTSIGLIPLILAITAVCLAPDRRSIRGWAILAVLSIWLAAGRQLGLFSILYEILPGFGRFRVPSRTLFLASLGTSILAGSGVDTLRRLAQLSEVWTGWARVASRWSLSLTVLVLTGAIIHASVTPPDPTIRRVPEYARIIPALSRIAHQHEFWVAAVGLWLILQIGRGNARSRRVAINALGLLGLAELAGYGAALVVVAPQDRFLGPDPISMAIERDRSPEQGSPLIRAVDSLYDDLRAGAHGFRKTNINDSFQIRHAAMIYEPLYRIFRSDPVLQDRPLDLAVTQYRRAIRQTNLDEMGVQYLVADRNLSNPEWPVIKTGVWQGSPYSVYRSPTSSARVAFQPNIRMTNSPQGLLWNQTTPDCWNISLTTTCPGHVILTETWMPGWKAEMGGSEKETISSLRGQIDVQLTDAGKHLIKLTYEPPGRKLGASVAIATIVGWLGLWAATSSKKVEQ